MKSIDKIRNFLEDYTRTKYFMDRVLKVRKDIGIPKNGAKTNLLPNNSDSSLNNTMDKLGLFLGIKYKNKVYPTYPAKMTKIYSELFKNIPKVYNNLLLVSFFNTFILYNQKDFRIFEEYIEGIGSSVCLINFRNDYLESEGCCDCELKVCENYMKEKSNTFPIMIGISPYATQNEVIDLVKKRWNNIQANFIELENNNDIPEFQKEKNEISKTRKKKSQSQKIEDIVYKNKKASLKSLVAIVDEKLGIHLDQGEIGKIRSLAIKRREK